MDVPLEIALFGPMRVLVEGHPLPKLRSRKALWFLAFLTLEDGAPVTRERLAFLLWPDTQTSTALANLRVVMSDLRHALGHQSGRLLAPDRSSLSLDIRGVQVDALKFDHAFANGDFALAAQLYHGELLEGCPEEWVIQERRVRQEQTLVALQSLAAEAERRGDHSQAVALYQKALQVEPMRDEPLRGLMMALSTKGDMNGALQAYREFTHRLGQNLGGVPDEKTVELYTRLRGKSRQTRRTPNFEKEQSDALEKGTLPHLLSPLIGREDERDDVIGRLRLNRLVSLTGVGGIGKTRLAIEVASGVRAAFTDGVWFVPLEALSEGGQVIQAIANALGFKLEAGASPLESLIKGLRLKRMLLVLDNCEHLLEVCAAICENLLRSCGELRFLTTSREAFGISGESVYRVPGLSVPALKHLPHNGATRTRVAMGYESVALFVERAQSVAPSFLLDADNAALVSGICIRLEGIPLAIELAAVQATSMSAASIAARLDDLLLPFATSHRTIHPRHQTVRATLDWSYDLLSLEERRALERLAVFVGGWTLEAAESVVGEEKLAHERVHAVLHALIKKSLVVFESRLNRYRLLEPVRQYAVEKLSAADDQTAVLWRHQSFFLRFAEKAEAALEGADQSFWVGKVLAEEENLFAVMEQPKAGLSIAGAIYRFWYIRGEFEKGSERVLAALAQNLEPTEARRKALYGASILLYCQRKYEEALLLCQEALSLAELLEDRLGSALALNTLASISHQNNNHDQERVYRQQSLLIFRELKYRRGIIASISSSAHCFLCRGEYDRAKPVFQEVLEIATEMGDLTNICVTRLQQGAIECFMGDYEAAQKHYEISRDIQEGLSSKRGVAMSLHGMGNVKNLRGEPESAKSLYCQALDLFRDVGDKPSEAAVLYALADIEGQQHRLPAANELIQESLALNRSLKNTEGLTEALRVGATIARLSDEFDLAASSIADCLHLACQVEQPQVAVEAFEEFGAICLERAEPARATKLWGVAGALRQWMQSPVPPSHQSALRSWRDKAAALLGSDEFARLTLEGMATDWREAARQCGTLDDSGELKSE